MGAEASSTTLRVAKAVNLRPAPRGSKPRRPSTLVCRLSGAAPPVPGGRKVSRAGPGWLSSSGHTTMPFSLLYILLPEGCVVHGNPTARPASGIVVIHRCRWHWSDGVAFNKSIADIPLQADAGNRYAVQLVVADDDVAGGVMAAASAVARHHQRRSRCSLTFVAGNQYVAGAGDEDAAGPQPPSAQTCPGNSIPDDLAGGAPADLNAVLRPAGMGNCPYIVVEPPA